MDIRLRCAAALAALALSAAPLRSAPPPGRSAPPAPAGSQVLDYTGLIDANQIGMRATNVGSLAYDVPELAPGFEYPRGSGKHAIFAAGLWLGAQVSGQVRVAIVDYDFEFGPGAMIGNTYDAHDRPEYKVYKLLRSYPTAAERDAALADYVAGAVPHGAPAVAAVPPASLDIGGDQVSWAVFNDADPALHLGVAGHTAPLGVEVQQTLLAYDRSDALGDAVLAQFKLINKGDDLLQSMCIGLWCDPDLGGYLDDFVGCDTTRALGYCYNSDGDDLVYGTAPPAVGIDILRGPLGSGGTPLGPWAFARYVNGTDPGSATEAYNRLQGLLNDGSTVYNPVTGEPTRYQYSGDPVAGTGWLDTNPTDRRMLLSTGPYDMAPGDTQVVWVAFLVGQGADRLASITALVAVDDYVQAAYDGGFQLVGVGPGRERGTDLRVWPNPGSDFAVSFALPAPGRARAGVYDLAGRQVSLLADRELAAGAHQLRWDGRGPDGSPAPGGIYFVRVEAAGRVRTTRIVRLP